jgi:hypothetical protein
MPTYPWDCLIRQDKVRTAPCVVCTQRTGKPIQAIVYACPIHGECTLARKIEGVVTCKTCPDRVIK